MSIEVDVYLREPKEVGSGKLLGRIFLESLPSLDTTFDTSPLGRAALSFSVKVGSIGHGTPRTMITVIPE